VNDQYQGAAIVELMGDFTFAVAGVQCGDYRTGLEHAEKRDFKLGTVRSDQPDTVALLDTHIGQGSGELITVSVDITKREPSISIDYCDLGRPLVGGVYQVLLYRMYGVRLQGTADRR
jgi:hypothetical protein